MDGFKMLPKCSLKDFSINKVEKQNENIIQIQVAIHNSLLTLDDE